MTVLVACQIAPNAPFTIRATHDDSQETLVLGLPDYAGSRVYKRAGAASLGGPILPTDEWLNAPESLADYCARRRWEILDEGRIQVGQASVPTDDNTQAKLTGGALKATRNAAYVIRKWKVAEDTFVVLDSQTIIAFADAVEARVQEMFDREAACSDGRKAGTVTTPAQAEAILAAPTQVGSP